MCSLLMAASCSKTAQRDTDGDFDYTVDRFADIEVLRYKVPDFDSLSLNQKILVYYLQEAALWGRDILWDQNYANNLAIRDLLEAVYTNYQGDRNSADFKGFDTYIKQVWFGNGIHHHYSTDKFVPAFSRDFLEQQIASLPEGAAPANSAELVEVIFNPSIAAKRVNQAAGADLVATSACNFYEPGLTQAEVEEYFKGIKDPKDLTPVSYGLNTRLKKVDGKIVEEQYRIGGLYSDAISHIVANLDSAAAYAENDAQRAIIAKLIEYYTTGDLKTFDDYSILWAEDTDSQVDFINGFIESYGDPLGMTGSWESIVNFKNIPASERTETLSSNAQWFENNSPVDSAFKKETVKGVSAKVITAAILAGDAYPATPIGINLPNANWIRAAHGSKSVTLENITQAYDAASHGNGFNEEFVIDQPTRDLLDQYLFITDNLHTDLHECLGHGSGKLLPGVDPDAIKEHGSTIEEAHMRNRKLIAEWAYEHGKADNVIEIVKQDGKTYIKINDYEALRGLFGELLAEIQRIRSTGDYPAAVELIEKYAVKVDPELHKEVLDRYAKLDIAPYKGFVNPVYTAVRDKNGRITDVKLDYTEGYADQMLRYSRNYSGLKH